MVGAGVLEHVAVALEVHNALLPRGEGEEPFQV